LLTTFLKQKIAVNNAWPTKSLQAFIRMTFKIISMNDWQKGWLKYRGYLPGKNETGKITGRADLQIDRSEQVYFVK